MVAAGAESTFAARDHEPDALFLRSSDQCALLRLGQALGGQVVQQDQVIALKLEALRVTHGQFDAGADELIHLFDRTAQPLGQHQDLERILDGEHTNDAIVRRVIVGARGREQRQLDIKEPRGLRLDLEGEIGYAVDGDAWPSDPVLTISSHREVDATATSYAREYRSGLTDAQWLVGPEIDHREVVARIEWSHIHGNPAKPERFVGAACVIGTNTSVGPDRNTSRRSRRDGTQGYVECIAQVCALVVDPVHDISRDRRILRRALTPADQDTHVVPGRLQRANAFECSGRTSLGRDTFGTI